MFDIDAHHAKRPMRLVQPESAHSVADPTAAMISAGINAAQDAAEAEGLTPASIVTAIYLAMTAARPKG